MTDTQDPAGGFKPRFALNLHQATAQRFFEVIEEFEKWQISLGELPSLGLNNGWYIVNQQVAEAWLLRNVKGANRKPSLPTVVYYAEQQDDNQWHRTGQGIIF